MNFGHAHNMSNRSYNRSLVILVNLGAFLTKSEIEV